MAFRSCLTAALVLVLARDAFASVYTCSDLAHQEIQSAQIGLPTHGAVVHSARHAKGAAGGYCRVLGSIGSLDPTAAPIRFEVNLPETWNKKAVQFGGGGFDGYLRQSDGRRSTVVGDKKQPSPLDRGYATFGSDSGHHHHYLFLPDIANVFSGRFGRNDEERNNFASDALKKTMLRAAGSIRLHSGATMVKIVKDALSDGQERTVLAFSAPQITNFSVENSIDHEPGYNVLCGADLIGNMGWFRHPFRPAIPLINSFYYVIGDGVVRSFLSSGPQVSLFNIETNTGSAVGHDPMQYLPRVREQSMEDDASLADLSPFQHHGGKLLLVHGVADSTIPTDASVLLYGRS